jgi:DNA end-binding protein Ku
MANGGSRSRSRGRHQAASSDAAADHGGFGRSFWSGTISFGLVTIPVSLLPANRSKRVALRMLDEDGTPLARRWFCPKDEQDLDSDEIVRGYEIAEDKYVVVTDEELAALAPRKSRDIDLQRFVRREEIDPRFFERGYFLAPATDSTKAYRLLAEVMETTGRAGLATFVMREKEYLVAILAENGILSAETMRFADELRTAEMVGLPGETRKPPRATVTKLERAIEALAAKRLDPRELEDEEAQRILQLVERKRKKGEDVVEVPELAADAEEQAEIVDLMEMLKRSLGARGASGPRRGPRSSPRASAGSTRSGEPGKKAAAGGAKRSSRAKSVKAAAKRRARRP